MRAQLTSSRALSDKVRWSRFKAHCDRLNVFQKWKICKAEWNWENGQGLYRRWTWVWGGEEFLKEDCILIDDDDLTWLRFSLYHCPSELGIPTIWRLVTHMSKQLQFGCLLGEGWVCIKQLHWSYHLMPLLFALRPYSEYNRLIFLWEIGLNWIWEKGILVRWSDIPDPSNPWLKCPTIPFN